MSETDSKTISFKTISEEEFLERFSDRVESVEFKRRVADREITTTVRLRPVRIGEKLQ